MKPYFLLLLMVGLLPYLASAQIIPPCNPTLPPNAPTSELGTPDAGSEEPCGLEAFTQLIQNIIKWLLIIALPIAALMLGWGGVLIMISAGSPEKINKGKEMIKIAIIGIVILLLSWLIVRAIFLALGVLPRFTPGGLNTGSSDL